MTTDPMESKRQSLNIPIADYNALKSQNETLAKEIEDIKNSWQPDPLLKAQNEILARENKELREALEAARSALFKNMRMFACSNIEKQINKALSRAKTLWEQIEQTGAMVNLPNAKTEVLP